jgi:glycosyltransferase involved in cell wall biosynthesis
LPRLILLSDPLLDDYGPSRPPILIGLELQKKGYEVSLVSPLISKEIEGMLDIGGVEAVSLGKRTRSKSSSYVWIETWLKEAFLGSNRRSVEERSLKGECLINFSGTILKTSDLWYLSGTVTTTVGNISSSFSPSLKLAYALCKPVLQWGDSKFIKEINKSKFVVANSNYCFDSYRNANLRVDAVIYPPLDLDLFRPTARRPSRDYAISYLGKETEASTLRKLAEAGIRIKMFGSKIKSLEHDILEHPNIELVGRVSSPELLSLYSNALFTVFPFTDEVFGYVPIESMACGTPVLTYDRQGPRESVLNGVTGWLCRDEKEIVQKGLRVWKEGYPVSMSSECVKRAASFGSRVIADSWEKLINDTLN